MRNISFSEYSEKRTQGMVRRFAPAKVCVLDQLCFICGHDFSIIVFALRKDGKFVAVPAFDFAADLPTVPPTRETESYCFLQFEKLDERFWHAFGADGLFVMEVFTGNGGELWSKVRPRPVRVVYDAATEAWEIYN
jgi:hypothetical protein